MRVLRVKRPKRVDAGPPVRAFFTRRGRATPAGSRAPHRGSCPRRARVDPGRIRQRSEDLAVLAVSRRVVPSWSDRGSAESTPRAYESYRERHARLVRNGSTEVERLEAAAAEVNDTVAAELLQRINEQLPEFLEKVVLQLLVAIGYAGSLGRAEHLGGRATRESMVSSARMRWALTGSTSMPSATHPDAWSGVRTSRAS